MPAKVCKKCGQSRPVYQETCGCSGKVKFRAETSPPPQPIARVPVTEPVTQAPIVTDGVTPVRGRAEPVTLTVTVGEECPTCGQVVKKRHASNADRQAAYRERHG